MTHKREKLFLFSYGTAVFAEILRHSHYTDFSGFSAVCTAMLVFACGLALVKFGLDVYDGLVSPGIIAIVFAGAVYMGFLMLRGQSDACMVLWIFIAASGNVDFNKIVKVSAAVLIFGILFVSLSSIAGFISDTELSRVREDVYRNRNALGFLYFYQLAYYSLFAELSWFYVRKEKLTLYEILSIAALEYLVFWQSDTRGPFMLALAGIFTALVLKLFPGLRDLPKLYTVLAVAAPLIMTALVVYQGSFVKETSSEFMRWFNRKMSGRLYLNYSGVHTMGFSFFGQPIDWSTGEAGRASNWVDSVYLYSLISYGIPFMAGFFAITTKLAVDAGRKKDVYMAAALIIIGVLGIWDNYCFRIECNPFYLFLAYAGTEGTENGRIKNVKRIL